MRAAIYARILLALFCLLALTTPASAECAWVLWTAPTHANGLYYPNELVVGWGYDKREACAQAAENITSRGGTMALCLPDTVDPRGPKEK